MANSISRGDKTPQLREERYSFDPTRGWIHRQHWIGFDQILVSNLQAAYAAAGIACDLLFENTIGELTTEDATQQYTLDYWQLMGGKESINGLFHPALSFLTSDQIAEVRNILSGIDAGNAPPSGAVTSIITDADPTSAPLQDLDDAQTTALAQFMDLQIRGATDYRASTYVLRHTTNAPSNYSANVADFNVDCVYTTSQLLSEVLDAELWINPLPGRLAYLINALGANPPTFRPNYLFGWIKYSSTQTTAANHRIEIVTEYELGQASIQPNGYYALANPASIP